jgi:hypothetical protein
MSGPRISAATGPAHPVYSALGPSRHAGNAHKVGLQGATLRAWGPAEGHVLVDAKTRNAGSLYWERDLKPSP